MEAWRCRVHALCALGSFGSPTPTNLLSVPALLITTPILFQRFFALPRRSSHRVSFASHGVRSRQTAADLADAVRAERIMGDRYDTERDGHRDDDVKIGSNVSPDVADTKCGRRPLLCDLHGGNGAWLVGRFGWIYFVGLAVSAHRRIPIVLIARAKRKCFRGSCKPLLGLTFASVARSLAWRYKAGDRILTAARRAACAACHRCWRPIPAADSRTSGEHARGRESYAHPATLMADLGAV